MLRKITGWFDWFLQNKQVWICIIMLMIMTRYGYLLYYNWNFGNTGKPGIQLYEDSDRYTEGAERIMHLSPLNDQQINYTGYIAVITLIQLFGGGIFCLIIVQLFLALIASLALYGVVKSISGNIPASILAAGAFLVNPFIAMWHLYIMTESMYMSFLIFSLWSINKAVENRSVIYYVLSFFIVCISASIRPNGWILPPIALTFYVLTFLKRE